MGQFLDDVIFGVEVIFYQKAPLIFLQNLLYESILILKSFRALFRKFANLSLKDAMSEALFYVAFCQMCHQMILLAKRLGWGRCDLVWELFACWHRDESKTKPKKKA